MEMGGETFKICNQGPPTIWCLRVHKKVSIKFLKAQTFSPCMKVWLLGSALCIKICFVKFLTVLHVHVHICE